MFASEEIYLAVEDILTHTRLPIPEQRLVELVLARLTTEMGGAVDFLYSPAGTYSVGQRLFNLAPRRRGWFMVKELMPRRKLLARYDSGTEHVLDHESRRKRSNWYAPENARKSILDALNALNRPGTIAQFHKYYVHHQRLRQVPYNQISRVEAFSMLHQLRDLATYRVSRNILKEYYRQHGLHHLYYIAPLGNLASILECGILARNLAPDVRKSFADEDIQKKRHETCPDVRLGLNLHDYVPLFFAPKPPLLYARRDEQESLVYLCINPGVLLEPGVVFSATNAVSADIFYRHVSDLDKLNWDILHANYWGSDDPFEKKSNKLLRQAEAEIPIYVAPDSILEIVVLNRGVAEDVIQLLNQSSRTIPVRIGPEYYCKC